MRLFIYAHFVQEVTGSRLGCGTIVGGVFHPARQLARFSLLNIPSILNLFRINFCGEAINYRPYPSLSFEVAIHVRNCHFSHYFYYTVFGGLLDATFIISATTEETGCIGPKA